MGDLEAIVAETQRVLQPIIAKVRRFALSTTFSCGACEAFVRISARERGRCRNSSFVLGAAWVPYKVTTSYGAAASLQAMQPPGTRMSCRRAALVCFGIFGALLLRVVDDACVGMRCLLLVSKKWCERRSMRRRKEGEGGKRAAINQGKHGFKVPASP